ncbi:MAG: hypothetical protein GDA50_07320 [Alphaproteobacteria bacterium GM202ARS2]|nr:hypothetical protein [Alphaproteobacteria bacterium GM202ARS2]
MPPIDTIMMVSKGFTAEALPLLVREQIDVMSRRLTWHLIIAARSPRSPVYDDLAHFFIADPANDAISWLRCRSTGE